MDNKELVKLWENEPDYFGTEKESGYHLVVFRHPEMKNVNGYVGVTRKHPWFGLGMMNGKVQSLDAHGGITYAGRVFDSVFKKKYWYFGFDTGHAGDLIPALELLGFKEDESLDGWTDTYRDFGYVSEHVESLFNQLKTIGDKHPNHAHSHVREYRRLHKIKVERIQLINGFKSFGSEEWK